jgi:SAM-dependent methyltransferase
MPPLSAVYIGPAAAVTSRRLIRDLAGTEWGLTRRLPSHRPSQGPQKLADSVAYVPTDADRSRSFGAVAADYDRVRPSPAAEALEWLLPERRDLVVDVGAGTGLFSRALANQGARVVAVEPDDRMRAVLQQNSPGIEAIAGSGEAIPLPDASADGVFFSSAWHWMDPDKAIPEVARVLRDGGRFGVIWTSRDHDSGWLRAEEWFRDAAPDGNVLRGEMPPAGPRRRREDSLPTGGEFTNIETRTFRYTRPMSPGDFVDWLTTYSRVITAPADVQERGRARATAALAEEFPGAAVIDVPMRSRCWRADRVPRTA